MNISNKSDTAVWIGHEPGDLTGLRLAPGDTMFVEVIGLHATAEKALPAVVFTSRPLPPAEPDDLQKWADGLSEEQAKEVSRLLNDKIDDTYDEY